MDADLPGPVALAWGLRDRPAKGPRRGLSVERIVAAAIDLATADGLGAVSMSRLAADLGTAPMSLYRYVASKDELLALMSDAAIGPAPTARRPGDGWRTGFGRWATAVREGMRRYPWLLRIPITGPPALPNQVAWMEEGLQCLRGTGLDGGEKISAIMLVNNLVRSDLALTADLSAAFDAAGMTADEAVSGYGRMLAKLIDPQKFPAVHELVADGTFDQGDDPDFEFTFGLARIFDGLDALIRSRA